MSNQLVETIGRTIEYALESDIVLPDDLMRRAMRVGAIKMIPDYGSAQHRAAWKASTKRVDKYVDEMMGELGEYFTAQEKALVKAKGNNPSVFNITFWNAAFRNKFYGVVSSAMFGVGSSEINKLNEQGANIPGFENTERLQLAIANILEQTAVKVNDTTYRDLIALFQEAAENGESIPAIQDRLSEFYDDRKKDWQTERIARTTMSGASNSADGEAWNQSGVVDGKTWISALIPNRTRADHADAHGQTVGLNESFMVGGELLRHPGDVRGSPGNIINCLCTQIAEVNF